VQRGDFMAMPFPGTSFDAAYAIEATCHGPDLLGMYREVFRVLKPGARFGTYEWCMTEQFDPENADHAATRRGIIEGNGLPELQAARDAVAAMQAAGFVVEAQLDRGSTGDIPWYDPFFPHRWEWATFRSSGRHPRATENRAQRHGRRRALSRRMCHRPAGGGTLASSRRPISFWDGSHRAEMREMPVCGPFDGDRRSVGSRRMTTDVDSKTVATERSFHSANGTEPPRFSVDSCVRGRARP
jgi:hypothetical protein